MTVEFDSDVISCTEQPLSVKYYDDDNKEHHYTPDFLLVRRKHKKQIVEIKNEEQAQKEEWQKLFRRVASILNRNGFEFVLITDRTIRVQPLLNNVKLLIKYSRVGISNENIAGLYHLYANQSEIPFRDLINKSKRIGISTQQVYALLRYGILSTDLKTTITGDSLVGFVHAPVKKAG